MVHRDAYIHPRSSECSGTAVERNGFSKCIGHLTPFSSTTLPDYQVAQFPLFALATFELVMLAIWCGAGQILFSKT